MPENSTAIQEAAAELLAACPRKTCPSQGCSHELVCRHLNFTEVIFACPSESCVFPLDSMDMDAYIHHCPDVLAVDADNDEVESNTATCGIDLRERRGPEARSETEGKKENLDSVKTVLSEVKLQAITPQAQGRRRNDSWSF